MEFRKQQTETKQHSEGSNVAENSPQSSGMGLTVRITKNKYAEREAFRYFPKPTDAAEFVTWWSLPKPFNDSTAATRVRFPSSRDKESITDEEILETTRSLLNMSLDEREKREAGFMNKVKLVTKRKQPEPCKIVVDLYFHIPACPNGGDVTDIGHFKYMKRFIEENDVDSKASPFPMYAKTVNSGYSIKVEVADLVWRPGMIKEKALRAVEEMIKDSGSRKYDSE